MKLLGLLILTSICASFSVFADHLVGARFDEMFCDAVLHGDVLVKTTDQDLVLDSDSEVYSIGIKGCVFSRTQRGDFKCEDQTGQSETSAIASRLFTVNNRDYSEFLITHKGKKIKTSKFIIHKHNVDGFPHPSECQVDETYVYIGLPPR